MEREVTMYSVVWLFGSLVVAPRLCGILTQLSDGQGGWANCLNNFTSGVMATPGRAPKLCLQLSPYLDRLCCRNNRTTAPSNPRDILAVAFVGCIEWPFLLRLKTTSSFPDGENRISVRGSCDYDS